MLQLEAIAFNHDPEALTHDALNIRRNSMQPILAPEWRSGQSVNFNDSVAAYAINETRGNIVGIKAQFSSRDPRVTAAEIRAISGRSLNHWPWFLPDSPPGWSGPDASSSDVLGDVEARQVEFHADGMTEFELFALPQQQLGRYGAGVHPLVWSWQFRRAEGERWTTFARSAHTIYTVISTPTAPWEQSGYPLNSQLPWTDVLDYACRWASGALTLDRAAIRITNAVYDHGSEVFEYNCPNAGSPMYVSLDLGPPPYLFNCTAVIERLRGGIGRGRYVNCSDCAAIVSTFANILGADLWQSRMGFFPTGFSTNPIQPIGSSRWEQPCGFWPGFGMHEVAWNGACGEDDEVFDACVIVDGDADPTKAPHTRLVPANIRYGRAGDGLYRDRLITPADRDACKARPTTRQRRRVV